MLPLTHVVHMTTIRREQQLPVPGAVLVRMNEKVQAGDVWRKPNPAAPTTWTWPGIGSSGQEAVKSSSAIAVSVSTPGMCWPDGRRHPPYLAGSGRR
jgi:hypothetical protein